MPSIEFAGQEVRLNPQNRSAFEKITALIYEEPDDDRATELLYALNVQRLRLAGSDFDDEVVQAGLWAMHDLGVEVVLVPADAETLGHAEAGGAEQKASASYADAVSELS